MSSPSEDRGATLPAGASIALVVAGLVLLAVYAEGQGAHTFRFVLEWWCELGRAGAL